MKDRKDKKTKKENKNKDAERSKGLVILPYIKGITEGVSRIFRKHQIATAMKPRQTIRNILVHPKDKTDKLDKSEVVYKVPCKNCEEVYFGETGSKL